MLNENRTDFRLVYSASYFYLKVLQDLESQDKLAGFIICTEHSEWVISESQMDGVSAYQRNLLSLNLSCLPALMSQVPMIQLTFLHIIAIS